MNDKVFEKFLKSPDKENALKEVEEITKKASTEEYYFYELFDKKTGKFKIMPVN